MLQAPLLDDLAQWAGMTDDQVQKVRRIQRKSRQSVLRAALQGGIISQSDYAEFLSQRLNLPSVDPTQLLIPSNTLELVSLDLLKKYQAVPFFLAGKKLFLAVADPEDFLALDDIRFLTSLEPLVHVAAPASIAKCLESIKENHADGLGALEDALSDIAEEDLELETRAVDAEQETSSLEAASQAPVVKMVNLIIMDAIRKKASDIHIEPYEKSFRVRQRIDGVLHEVMRPPIRLKNAMVSRIKIMARLNIAEKRLPQDGRIKVRTPGGKHVEFRISVLPTLFGEKVVMRLLDKSALKVDMTQLGFDEPSLAAVKAGVAKPYGMVLVTGPTGSGKTTTLYSAIMELNKEDVNISTAEDPVEFSLHGINQVQVLEEVGLTFAASLRSFLRQDPDVILVGEIRDLETAEIAIKAALTGHLVLSTLHTNDAPSTLSRLLNMGVENFLVASSVNIIVAQRLVRKLCPFCRRKVLIETGKLLQLGLEEGEIGTAELYEPVGCTECSGTGYRGRSGIYEVLTMTPELQEMVLAHATVPEIRRAAMEQGMITLRRSALNKLTKGVTSIQEVLRATTE
jgi:type IV pilus assembly protein PilB